MKKHISLFAALLALFATSVLGQIVLTIDGQSVSKANIVITTQSTAPVPVCTGGQVLVGNACACPAGTSLNGGQCTAPIPVTPPAGCAVVDAPTQLGGNPPISPTQMGALQTIAFKIPWDLLDNKSVGAYQPSTGMTVAISSQPCDIGVGAITNVGCYNTLPGNNPQQILIRVGDANGIRACKRPPPNNGYLYVNFAWTGYSNFGQPLTNFCVAAGLSTCHFQFRRDS